MFIYSLSLALITHARKSQQIKYSNIEMPFLYLSTMYSIRDKLQTATVTIFIFLGINLSILFVHPFIRFDEIYSVDFFFIYFSFSLSFGSNPHLNSDKLVKRSRKRNMKVVIQMPMHGANLILFDI